MPTYETVHQTRRIYRTEEINFLSSQIFSVIWVFNGRDVSGYIRRELNERIDTFSGLNIKCEASASSQVSETGNVENLAWLCPGVNHLPTSTSKAH